MGLFARLFGSGPNSVDDFLNRGDDYLDEQAYDKAVADYTEAIRLDPENAVAYRTRGVAYDNLEEYDRALADLTQAIQLDSNDAIAYWPLVKCHVMFISTRSASLQTGC